MSYHDRRSAAIAIVVIGAIAIAIVNSAFVTGADVSVATVNNGVIAVCTDLAYITVLGVHLFTTFDRVYHFINNKGRLSAIP